MIVVDDFLESGSWDKLRQENLWTQRHSTFLTIDSEPKKVLDQIAFDIWDWYIEKHKPEHAYGIESWINSHSGPSENPLPWHRDKDERHYEKTSVKIHPMVGIVLYGHNEIPNGGYLEIKRDHGTESIEPVPNRLVVFDSSLWHRVTPMKSGERRTLASNLWDRHVNK